MKTKLLKKIQEFLLAEPRRFDMRSLIRPSSRLAVLEQPPCGTACCIAGAAYIVSNNLNPTQAMDFITGVQAKVNIETEAKKALGLTKSQANKLFYSSVWPARFRRAYDEAETPADRVQAGIKRINYFIKTKGK